MAALASRLKKAAAAARDSAFSSVNTAASTVWSAGNAANAALEDSDSEEQEEAEDEDDNGADADGVSSRRIAYIAVSRNGDMLAEVADRETLEVERDFAVALGRKMIRRKAPAGWDEMSGGRHHVIRLPLHDSAGSTSYIVCFGHTFPANLAQAFAQKLSLMLDPMIEKCTEITESLLESTILVILPVLERELERANSGVKTHQSDSLPLPQEVRNAILQNVEVLLERDRSLKRHQLEKQTKFNISVGNAKRKKESQAQDKAQGESQSEAQSEAQGKTKGEAQSEAEAGQASQDAAKGSGAAPNAEASNAGKQQESKESQQEPQPILQPGVAVIMYGLTGAAELNGRPGQCEQWVAESGRWRVRLESGEHKDIKSGNLALQSTQSLSSMQGKQLLRKGIAVVIHGLSGAKELNGLKAHCEQWLEESGRWRVRLESGEHKDIKPGSLALQSVQPEASAPSAPGAGSAPGASAASSKPSATSAPNASTTQSSQGSSWFKPKQRKKAPEPAGPPPEPPQSPRTRARKLVGDRLGEAQAERAAELILKLEPYVDGKKTAYLDDIWTFFDVPKPPGNSFSEGDSTAKSLKGKLNRQRLLLHPDKNGHPQAEKTFKFLEQCNQRLQDTCMRGGRRESARQRTQREEEELHREKEERRKQEEERAAAEEKRKQEEDERFRREEEEAEKRRIEQEKKDQRLDWLKRQASELSQGRAERAAWLSRQNSLNSVPGPTESRPSRPEIDPDDFIAIEEDPSELGDAEAPPLQPPPSQPGVGQPNAFGPPQEPASKLPGGPLPAKSPGEPVGKLTLTVIAARDLPAGNWMMETKTYAVAGVGSQRFQTEVLPGTCPAWGSTFEFDVRMEDRGLFVGIWREGWGFRLLGDDFLGRIEIPFLDLEDWGGCVIGRMLESADPEISECMHLELKASIDWF